MSFFPRRTDQPRPRQEQNHFIDTPGFTTHGVPYNPQATVIHTDPCGPAPFPHRRTAGPSDVGHVNIPVEGPLHTGPDMERQRHLAQPHVQGEVLRQMDPVYLQPAGSVEPPQLHSPGWKREREGRLGRSGRHLRPLLPDIFEAANPSNAGRGLPKSSRMLPGNPPGSFLLPSYPLVTLPGVQLTPTLHRRQHKRDRSPRRRDPGPWRDSTGEVGSSRCPPLPVLTSRTRVTRSGLMRPSPPTFTRLPPLPKPAGREPLRAFRPAKGSQVQSTRAVPAEDMCEGVVGRDELKRGTPREDPHEHQILQPFSKPDLVLAQSFRLLSSDNWEKKIEGLMSIRRLAQYHADVLGSRLHDVCIVLIQEVLHLRSAVSRMAVVSLRELYSSLQKRMDQEVEATAKVLLHKAAESNAFIRQDVDTALDSMVQNCTPIRSMNALLAGGLCHLNAAVRKCTARHLATLVEKIGAERIIPAVSKLAQDSSQETRRLGRRMLLFLSSHHDFDKMVEKYIPAKDLATIRDTLKSKERTKVSRIPKDEMRQPRLEQQEAPAAQAERHNTQRIKRSLRNTVRDVSPDDAAPLKDLQLNNNVPAQTSRRATGLIRARPFLSNSPDELKPGTPRKDPHEQQTLRPFSKPGLALAQSFRLLSSDDWEKKIEGLMLIRKLAQYHSGVLGSRLHDVCIVLIQEVRNLRSRVSRTAVVSLRELYSSLQKGMDQEVAATAKVLLHKAAESNAFIRQDVDTALDSMVQNCTPIRSMNALLAGGLCHQNAAVRKCTAQHLATLVEKIGAGRLLSGAKNVTGRIIPAVYKLAQDSSQETRRLGRRMLLFLSSHHDFDKMVEKYIPAKDLATIRDTLKSKERTKVSRIPKDEMRQPRLEQQEAPAAQAERHNTQRIKRSLRNTVRDVSPDDAAPLKDLQLNSNVPAQTSRRATRLITAHPSLSNSSVSFTSRYTVGDLLGSGGYGAVYAGVRKADGKQIAIKYVPKHHEERFITVPGKTRSLPLEVALMKMVCKPPRCEHIVELLDWMEYRYCFILILERPVPCMDLFRFLDLYQRQLPEPLARRIMRQVVQAVLHCRDRGVLHRDIKEENLLVNTDTLDVKLIDFGCGDLLTTGPYSHFRGTMVYCPPEWLVDRMYEGRQATIWSLGVLLYSIICGHVPFRTKEDIVEAHLCFKGNPSRECRHLITWCLQKDPEKRPVLEDVLAHQWFLEGLQN
ncbi:uncharacterized protein LOC143525774 isoform X1 [Brachyhypopomus gauderio]|uniref:uncharacterized protein LOC143525774 isoform X1 n=1 Tax=Brachyhypopomus gauderio TaxID=698409 RepID=UPI004042B6D4